jgi:hypothetical protein
MTCSDSAALNSNVAHVCRNPWNLIRRTSAILQSRSRDRSPRLFACSDCPSRSLRVRSSPNSFAKTSPKSWYVR